MELHLAPETEAKLNELSQRTRRGTDELLQEAVQHLVRYGEWFDRKVTDSVAPTERGETVPDEDVPAWLEQREHRSMRTGWSAHARSDLKVISQLAPLLTNLALQGLA